MAETKKNTKATKNVTKKQPVKKNVEKVVEPEEKEVKEVKEVTDTFENGKKNIGKTIWNIVFWTLIIGLFAIWTTDFIQVKREKEPIFCVKEVEHKYPDGTTKECVGLGYKVYTYNRTSIKIKKQFSPFFVSMEE